ncbi:hypothetical protein MP228_001111 [Amoeboaphelidium protococcarum]|nr:hypothetical protein MP228_001111 [Amoeboaphelidium protococcarum]
MIEEIWFTEFHLVQGPQIALSTEGRLTADGRRAAVFDLVSDQLIPKHELTRRDCVARTEQYTIVGYPMLIQDSKYERNSMLFNLCLVLDGEDQCRWLLKLEAYIFAARRIAHYLEYLEQNSGFIFNLSSEIQQKQLQQFMYYIQQQLNEGGELICQLDDSIPLTIQIPSYMLNSSVDEDVALISDQKIQVHQVPVLMEIINYEDDDYGGGLDQQAQQHLVMDEFVDLTVQRVIPLIDGVLSISQIAKKCGIQVELVELCIKHFVSMGLVKLIEPCGVSKTQLYLVSKSVLQDQNILSNCLKFSLPQHTADEDDNTTRDTLVTIEDVSAIFRSFAGGKSIEVVSKEHHELVRHLDLRRLLSFAQLNGILAAVQRDDKSNANAKVTGTSSRQYPPSY